MRLWNLGFELNSNADGVEIKGTDGSNRPTVSNEQAHSGTYSMKLNQVASTGALIRRVNPNSTNGPMWLRVYVYISSVSGTTDALFFFAQEATADRAKIKLAANRTLELWSNSAKIGSSSSAIPLNEWHRVELYYKNNTVTGKGEYDARLDGVSFASTTTSTDTGAANIIYLGTNSGTPTRVVYLDDIAVNDSSGSGQTSWPGPGRLKYLLPNAAGDVNTFGTQTGGTAGATNNFGRVSETTPDDATTFNGSNTLNQEDLYNVTNSGITNPLTINCVQVAARFRGSGASSNSSFKLEARKTASGTKTQSAAITPADATWVTNDATYMQEQLTMLKDPDGADWTVPNLDSMQIGAIITTASTNRVDISKIWAIVDYTPFYLSKSSVNGDATFSGTGDPHPWPSGNAVGYTVQNADILLPNTTYYWKVKGLDPLGTNTYGASSAIRSFTTSLSRRRSFPLWV